MTRTLRFLKKMAVPLALLLAWSAGSVRAQTYCTPTYTTGCQSGDDINNFTLIGAGGTSFVQNGTGCPGGTTSNLAYSDYTTLSPVSLLPGNTYSGTISSSYQFGSENFRFFIDFNNDGFFDSSATSIEAVGFAGPTVDTTAISFSITIPLGVPAGLHRMRVRSQWSGIASSINPCQSVGWGETHDYTVSLGTLTPCAGTPLAGTAVASVATICPNQPFTVSLQGGTSGVGGLTYQLEVSTTGAASSFTPAGAAQASPSFSIAGITATRYYRIVTTCTSAGGGSATSVADTVNANLFTACYCNANLGGGSCLAGNGHIVDFTLNTLSNLASGCNTAPNGTYTSYPPTGSNTTSLVLGSTYTITLNTDGLAISSVWIDYNQDGTWSPSEHTQVATSSTNATVTITIPTTALTGATGMRVRSRAQLNPNGPPDACTTFGSGETEDYTVTLIAPMPCAGTPNAGTANASNTNPCPGTQVTIGLSGGTIATNITYSLFSSTTSATTGFGTTPIATNATGLFTVTPLAGNTWYRIVTTCGNTGGGTATSTSVLVTGQGPITTLPWNDGLESVTTTGNNFPQCWRRVNGDWQTQDASWWFSNDPRTGIRYLTNGVSGTQNEWIMTPGFQLTGGTSYDFSFYWVGDNNSGWTGNVGVNNIQDSTGATILGAPFVTSTTTTSNSQYQQVIRTFVPTTSGTYFFGVRVSDNFFGSNLGFDDFRVNVTPTCPQPIVSAVTAITATTATYNWTPAAANPALGYQYETRTSGAPGSGATGLVAAASGFATSTATSVPVTGLTGVTGYTVYVRAICSPGDSSFWSSVTFTTSLNCTTATPITACGASQSFSQNATGGAYNPVQTPTGPSTFGTPGVEKLYTFTAPVSGTYTLDVSATNSEWVDYFFKPAAGGCGNSNWTFIDDIISPTTPGFAPTLTLTAGTQYYILVDPEAAFTATFAAQTFTINCPPTCAAPTNLNVTTTTASAALSWTQGPPGTPTQWQISYGPTGTVAGAGTTLIAGANPFTITGLTPSTGYTFYVRAICGPGDTSLWTAGFDVNTQCLPASLPFVENFSNLNFNFPPTCWTLDEGPLTATPTSLFNVGFSDWFEDGYLNNGTTGAAKVNIYNTFGPQQEWMISPSINLGPTPGNFLLEFNFGVLQYFSTTPATLGSDDTLAVVVSTDNGLTWSLANALQVWTAANTPVNTTTGGQRFFLPMNGYSGTVKIGWYGSNGVIGNTADNDIFVDSIRLTSSCTPPVVNLGNDTTVCGNVSSLILNAGSFGAGTTYSWSSPVATIPATTQTINVAPAINFTNVNNASTLINSVPVTATVTTSSNCSASDTINISVIFTPRVGAIGVTGNDPTFTFSPVSDTFATAYNWNFGDNSPAATTPNATHTYVNNGTYTVRLVVSNACGTDTVTQSVTVVNGTNGIDNVLDGATISLYPNPTAADAVLEVGDGAKLRGVQVMSATGQLVMERQAAKGNNRMTLRTGTLAPGIYTLRIQLDKGVVMRKLEVLK